NPQGRHGTHQTNLAPRAPEPTPPPCSTMDTLELLTAGSSEPRTETREQLLALEWLDTNGLGGFATSSVAGANTRKYHGLLISRTPEPHLLLSKLDATLISAGQRLELSTISFPGAVHPNGWQRL